MENNKKALRNHFLNEIQIFSNKAEENSVLNQLLIHWWNKDLYPQVLGFGGLQTEPDLEPFWAYVINHGQLFFPKIQKEHQMTFHEIQSLNGPWQIHPYGIPEPVQTAPLWKAAAVKTLVLIPGLAFTNQGLRLGRGGGYYDRFLQKHKDSLFTMGVGWTVSETETLPSEPFDQRLNAWVNPKGFAFSS